MFIEGNIYLCLAGSYCFLHDNERTHNVLVNTVCYHAFQQISSYLTKMDHTSWAKFWEANYPQRPK